MPTVLVCSASPLDDDLSQTVLSRDDVIQHLASTVEDAVEKAAALMPDLVLVDRDMPAADRVVSALRRDARARRTSIVVIARGELDPVEVELLEHGANAILRLPVAGEWDERLERLMQVPMRRETRLQVSFEVEARTGSGVEGSTATALNLSVSGMLIDSAAFALHIGDDIDFSFQLPGGDVTIRGCGRVVRQAGRTQFGLEFYGLEGDGRDQIEAWVASRAEPV
jgi:CheY-like chemotaxis protein